MMAEFKNTIDVLGDDVATTSIIDRTITEFHDDVLTTVGRSAFQNCSYLVSVDLPNVVSIANNAFSDCSSLASINLPNVMSIPQSAFEKCSSLVSVDLPNVASIGLSVFNGCKKLNTLILRNQTVCTLDGIYALNNTPFASGGTGGTVYVPQALITEYQNATNWSTLYAAGTCNFVAIEGSEYE